MLAADHTLPGVADAESTVQIDGPFDLRTILSPHLRGRGDPTMRLGIGEAWLAMRTPDGLATLRLTTMASGRVRAQAWGSGAAWAAESAPGMLGADDDPLGAIGSVAAPIAAVPLLREMARARPALLRIGRSRLVMASLVPAILEQKVTGSEARRAWRSIVRGHGEPAPGPGAAIGLRVMPSAGTLAALPYYAYHPAGVEQRRAETIRRVAARAVWIEEAVALDHDAARERLLAMPGVGPWTAAEVGYRALGDPDAVSVGDYHLPQLVGWALARERRADDARMLELLAPFAGQRARIVRLIEASGVTPEARGPRMTPRRIERH